MPELPEVESLRRALEKKVLGQKIKKVVVNKPKLISGKGNARRASIKKTKEFIKDITGERFLKIERRAKNLIFRLSKGKIILAHLKMSGQFAYNEENKTLTGGHPIEISESKLPNKHTHIVFTLTRGTLYYNDTRMFGYLLYYPSAKSFEAENHFKLLGLEPFSKEFTPKYLFESFKKKRGKIKSILLGQSVVTGLGNIYVDEVLFRVGIHPKRKAFLISQKETKRLHTAIIKILSRAIKMGGSSVATYRLLDETKGNYAREHKVYGKAGKKCSKAGCKGVIKRKTVAGRSTHFCDVHQI